MNHFELEELHRSGSTVALSADEDKLLIGGSVESGDDRQAALARVDLKTGHLDFASSSDMASEIIAVAELTQDDGMKIVALAATHD